MSGINFESLGKNQANKIHTGSINDTFSGKTKNSIRLGSTVDPLHRLEFAGEIKTAEDFEASNKRKSLFNRSVWLKGGDANDPTYVKVNKESLRKRLGISKDEWKEMDVNDIVKFSKTIQEKIEAAEKNRKELMPDLQSYDGQLTLDGLPTGHGRLILTNEHYGSITLDGKFSHDQGAMIFQGSIILGDNNLSIECEVSFTSELLSKLEVSILEKVRDAKIGYECYFKGFEFREPKIAKVDLNGIPIGPCKIQKGKNGPILIGTFFNTNKEILKFNGTLEDNKRISEGEFSFHSGLEIVKFSQRMVKPDGTVYYLLSYERKKN